MVFTGTITYVLRFLDAVGRGQTLMNLPGWIGHPAFGAILIVGGFLLLVYLTQQPETKVGILGPTGIPYESPKHPVLGVGALALFVAVISSIPFYCYFRTAHDYVDGSIRPLQWGTEQPNLAYVVVDAKELIAVANEYRLMVIARPKDDTIDAKEDTVIDKSSLFEITQSTKKLQLRMSKETMTRMGPIGNLQLWVLIVPHTIKLDDVHKINDAIKMGAKVAATPGLIVYPGFKTEPPVQLGSIENPELKAQALELGIKDPQIVSVDLKARATATAVYSQRDRPGSFVQLDFDIGEVGKDTITVAVRGTMFDRGKLWSQFGPLRENIPSSRKTFTFHFTGKTTDGREIAFPAVRFAILKRDQNNLTIATGLSSQVSK